jgi:exodeoxyribonuclease VII small subunit
MAKKSFEEALKQLEKIVQELESGDLPLEKAMQKFEEGMQLSKYCSDKLDETEKKIQVLLKDQEGQLVEQPFLTDENDDA